MHYSQHRKHVSTQNGSLPGTPRPDPAFPEGHVTTKARPSNQKISSKSRSDFTRVPSTDGPQPQENLPEYIIWVKNEPFDFGILSPLPCPKIGINILRKIAEYCREKPGYYPELSLNQWYHICKYKLQLATDLCTTYFRVFDILTRNPSQWTQISSSEGSRDPLPGESWDWKFNRAVKQGTDANNDFSVNTMQFLLFLYTQHFLRLHKKDLHKSFGDEPWPELLHRGSPAGAQVPEQQQTEFIIANLPGIIEFLTILLQRKELSSRIHLDVVRALSLILGVGCTSPNTEYKSLDECLQLTEICYKCDYNRQAKTVDKKAFMEWIVHNLKINPWGPSSIPIPQMPVLVSTGVWDDPEVFKQNKIFWNTQSFPKTWFLISGVEKQVLIMDKLEHFCSIKLHRCSDSIIYLPGVFSNILVQKCHGVKLMLGVAAKVVKFVDCSKMSVSSVGRQHIISDVAETSFCLMTSSGPIICGSRNHEICLAPYNTSYPGLISHMKIAGMSPKLQKWLRPLEISNDGFPRAFQKTNVLPLALDKFSMALFPFRIGPIGGQTYSLSVTLPLPGTLPTVYQRRVDHSQDRIHIVRQAFMDSIQFSEEDTDHIFQITLLRFKKWLRETGHYDQIVGLRSLQKTLEQNHPEPVACSKGHDLSCLTKVVKNFFKRDDPTYFSSQPRCGPSNVKPRDHEGKDHEQSFTRQFSSIPSVTNF